MTILAWLLLAAAILAVFALWDLLFCGGRRCGSFIDRGGA
jgi:hypothetical protein